jgi:hypothetical protein
MLRADVSAFAAIRALRDVLKARLDMNEDFRAWRALDDIVSEVEPRSLSTPPGLADTAMNFPASGLERKVA